MAKKPAKRPRLGRGLASLITNSKSKQADGDPPLEDAENQDPQAIPAEHTPLDVPLAEIVPNPFQPRKEFDESDLTDLAASIAQQGILQPLVIAPSADDDEDTPYVLIAGERRLRAAKQAGLESVPCFIRNPSRQQMLEWALVENLQRTDLNAMERATAYRDYIDRFSLTQAQAAERLGQPRTTIANHLRLLDLCGEVQDLIRDGKLTFGHGKVLGALIGRPEPQQQLARRITQEGLSVRQLEDLVAQVSQPSGKPAKSARSKEDPAQSAYIRDVEEQLTHAVGTRVSIRPKKSKNAGRIVIDYYNLEDFDRITASLGVELES